MEILFSLLALAVIVGIVVWFKKKGLMQHTGCTCRHLPGETHEHKADAGLK